MRGPFQPHHPDAYLPYDLAVPEKCETFLERDREASVFLFPFHFGVVRSTHPGTDVEAALSGQHILVRGVVQHTYIDITSGSVWELS